MHIKSSTNSESEFESTIKLRQVMKVAAKKQGNILNYQLPRRGKVSNIKTNTQTELNVQKLI